MVYEDGNGSEHARQDIPFTDFPYPSKRFTLAGMDALAVSCQVSIDLLSLRACKLARNKNIRMKLVSLKP